tara:strand:+ start:472 stop:687 length:216 start_codon:yes stop_codon:yes gene_type:complete
MFDRILDKCPNCESDNFPFILYDKMGMSCGYVCDCCIKEKKSKYDPCIFKDDTREYRQKVAECGEEFEPDE